MLAALAWPVASKSGHLLWQAVLPRRAASGAGPESGPAQEDPTPTQEAGPEGAGTPSPQELCERLQNDPAHQDVLQPLLSEVRTTYAKFLFRTPSAEDVARHLLHFVRFFPSLERCRDAVRLGKLRPYLGIRPLAMEMDVVNQCNLRCVMCHFSNEAFYRRKKQEISVTDFERIAEQIFPLCGQLSLSLGTEPLLHRRFDELLTVTAKYQVPFVQMHTNGTLLTEKLIDCLIETRFTQINISIDAA